MRATGIITSEHDPMYEAKRWLFWHSTIGLNEDRAPTYGEICAGDYDPDHEAGLMERFTDKVLKAVNEAIDGLDIFGKDRAAYKRYLVIRRKYHERRKYYRERNM